MRLFYFILAVKAYAYRAYCMVDDVLCDVVCGLLGHSEHPLVSAITGRQMGTFCIRCGTYWE